MIKIADLLDRDFSFGDMTPPQPDNISPARRRAYCEFKN